MRQGFNPKGFCPILMSFYSARFTRCGVGDKPSGRPKCLLQRPGPVDACTPRTKADG